MKKLIIAGGVLGALVFGGVALATGPEGAIITPKTYVCSGTGSGPNGSNSGQGGACTYRSTVAGGYVGVGPWTISYLPFGATTATTISCAANTECDSGPNPSAGGLNTVIPAGSKITVTSTGGGVAVGTLTNGPNP